MAGNAELAESNRFVFYKGNIDVLAQDAPFDWKAAASKVRSMLGDALNSQNVAFLLGSGCSSLEKGSKQLGIPTMAPLAENFVGTLGGAGETDYVTASELASLESHLGLKLSGSYASNLEKLMEVLFSFRFGLKSIEKHALKDAGPTVDSVISKVSRYIYRACTQGAFAKGDESVLELYMRFYRNLVFRDRSLPRPWIFTTNYDLFNETAMDRIGIHYCNGFSGTVERRFNPATYRYSLAQQLDVSSRKWTAVDSFVYLCKLHGSVNWIEEKAGLLPIREVLGSEDVAGRAMIYPTPSKQSASFGSPYSDLFREFQSRVVRDQSVLFVHGYSFGDEHVNNIIFQALTIPSFRLIAFVPNAQSGAVKTLRELDDPRIWLIGGSGPEGGEPAHYFRSFVEEFMPEPPSNRVDAAVEKVLHSLVYSAENQSSKDDDNAF